MSELSEAVELIAAISEAMNFPEADDPLDVLKGIARLIGDDHYTYFDERGQWVYWPAEGDG